MGTKKSLAKALSAVLACGILFTACGGAGAKSSEGAAGSGGGTDQKATGKISVMTAMAYGTDELDKVLDAFKAKNPGIEIDVQHIPNDYDQTLTARFNSGDIPDIFVQQTGAKAQSYSEYAYDFTNDPIVDKFQTSAIDISKNADGKLMSLPWTYESMAFIINKDIFEKAGITEYPKTLDELEKVCQKIQDAGFTPFSVGMKEKWVLAHVASHFVATEDPDAHQIISRIDSGELGFDTMKDFKNVFPLLDMMVKYGPSKPLEVDWELSENDLANGRAAIIHMGDWCEATLKDFNPDAKFDFMPVPVSNDGTDPTFLSSISWQFILHKDSPMLEKSKELMEFMLTSDEGIEWMTQGVKAIPAAKTDVLPDGVLATAAQEKVNAGQALPWNHTLWPADYNNKLGAELQRYLLGEATAEEVMANLNELWKG